MLLVNLVNLEKYSDVLEFTHNKLINYTNYINFLYIEHNYNLILDIIHNSNHNSNANLLCLNILKPSKNLLNNNMIITTQKLLNIKNHSSEIIEYINIIQIIQI